MTATLDSYLSPLTPDPSWAPAIHTPRLSGLTDGDDLGEFCSRFLVTSKGMRAGGPLDLLDWQRWLLAWMTERNETTNLWRYRQILVSICRKTGKALALDTPVLTRDGWKSMGTVEVGDEVHAIDGSLTPVVAVSDVMTGHDCYRVTFKDGQSFIADADHEWTVFDRRARREVTLTTAEMSNTYLIGNRPTHNERRYRVAVDRSLQYPTADLPIDPWLLGYWLGNGDTSGSNVTVGSQDIDYVEQRLDVIGEDHWTGPTNSAHRIHLSDGTAAKAGEAHSRKMLVRLRSLGLIGHKHIPLAYLQASTAQRIDLLAGLLDSDGHVTDRGQGELVLTSEVLIEDALTLMRSLGIKGSIHKGTATLNGVEIGPKYRINFTPIPGSFQSPRKAEKMVPSRNGRALNNYITHIEQVASEPVRCIRVEHPSHLFLVGRGFTPTHNSLTSAALALYYLVIEQEMGREIFSVANDRQQAALIFNEAKFQVLTNPALGKHLKVYKTAIEHPASGSVYKVLSSDHKLAHGTNPSITLFDEVWGQPNEELWQAMATGSGARAESLLIGISTPGDMRDDALFTRLWDYGNAVANGEVEDPSFGFAAWMANAGCDILDEAEWARANPNLPEGVADIEEMRSAARQTPEHMFRRLRLGQPVRLGGIGWMDMAAWTAQARPEHQVEPGTEIVMAFDGSVTRDATALMGMTMDGHAFVLGCWEADEDDPEWSVPRGEVEAAIEDAFALYKVRSFQCDTSYWLVEFQRWVESYGKRVVLDFTMSNARMVPAVQELFAGIKDGKITHSGDARLTRHVSNAITHETPRGITVRKEAKDSRHKIDLAVAMCMANDARLRVPTKRYYSGGF